MHFLHLFIQKKSFFMMTTLMLGTMCALIIASAWLSLRKGIIDNPDTSYDYIIVGAGTAGCVLTSRLVKDKSNPKVLLVEAGDIFPWWSYIPLAAPFLQESYYDWAYRTTPQLHSSRGLKNRISAWPRGRGLGGSGHINYMVHFPGTENDFKKWEEMGISGWTYDEMMSTMKSIFEGKGRKYSTSHNSCDSDKLLDYPGDEYGTCSKRQPRELHTIESANLYISPVGSEISELSKTLMEGSEELKESLNNSIHFIPTLSTIQNGFRWSTFDGFLKPVLGKNNLHVSIQSRATKILFSGEGKAIGIEIQKANNQTLHIYVNKEIILTAGAINTPQILLSSGVGPKDDLEKLKIHNVKNLPVGLGLHDHLNLPLYVRISKPVSITFNKIMKMSELLRYSIIQEGFLASSGIAGVGSISPDGGIVLFGLGSIDENVLQRVANYEPKVFKSIFPFTHNASQEGFVLLVSCLQPQSRGTVVLRSVDPTDTPIIDPKYLSNQNDIHCMSNAFKMAARLLGTKPFQNLGVQLHLPKLDECKNYHAEVDNDSYIECLLRTIAITGYHPGGTCKMGTQNDTSTVVDSLLRVHGIPGLRIADASVLPTPISGHPNSVIATLASRAASFILNSQRKQCG